MSLIGLLTGQGDYISLVKEYLEKVFVHEAKKYECKPEDMKVIIYREPDGQIQIGTYSNVENKVLRIIPDKEVQNILMK